MNHRMLTPALALIALVSAQAAQAQQPACVAAADLGDAVVYAMPIAFDAVQTACANRLARNGFIATGGAAFIADFRAGQNKAWPGALRVLKTFMAEDGKDGSDPAITAMITELPEESLRPFVDGLVGQLIADEIKGDSCGLIERGMQLISPLPRENVGGMFAFIAEVVDLKKPSVCPAPDAKTKR